MTKSQVVNVNMPGFVCFFNTKISLHDKLLLRCKLIGNLKVTFHRDPYAQTNMAAFVYSSLGLAKTSAAF